MSSLYLELMSLISAVSQLNKMLIKCCVFEDVVVFSLNSCVLDMLETSIQQKMLEFQLVSG